MLALATKNPNRNERRAACSVGTRMGPSQRIANRRIDTECMCHRAIALDLGVFCMNGNFM